MTTMFGLHAIERREHEALVALSRWMPDEGPAMMSS